MTHLVKCNKCERVQEAKMNHAGDPINPVNPNTNALWWSRLKDGKTIHACSRECMDDGLVWPV